MVHKCLSNVLLQGLRMARNNLRRKILQMVHLTLHYWYTKKHCVLEMPNSGCNFHNSSIFSQWKNEKNFCLLQISVHALLPSKWQKKFALVLRRRLKVGLHVFVFGMNLKLAIFDRTQLLQKLPSTPFNSAQQVVWSGIKIFKPDFWPIFGHSLFDVQTQSIKNE